MVIFILTEYRAGNADPFGHLLLRQIPGLSQLPKPFSKSSEVGVSGT